MDLDLDMYLDPDLDLDLDLDVDLGMNSAKIEHKEKQDLESAKTFSFAAWSWMWSWVWANCAQGMISLKNVPMFVMLLRYGAGSGIGSGPICAHGTMKRRLTQLEERNQLGGRSRQTPLWNYLCVFVDPYENPKEKHDSRKHQPTTPNTSDICNARKP